MQLRGILLLFSVAACERVANLDVVYDDAGVVDAGVDATEASVELPPPTSETAIVDKACPCDKSAGQGCCVLRNDLLCAEDSPPCAEARGIFLRCLKPDPSSESVCCWHGEGAGATTAYAAICAPAATACLENADCSDPTEICHKADCGKVTIGRCGPAANAAPACP